MREGFPSRSSIPRFNRASAIQPEKLLTSLLSPPDTEQRFNGAPAIHPEKSDIPQSD
jgi:hypothetical protein